MPTDESNVISLRGPGAATEGRKSPEIDVQSLATEIAARLRGHLVGGSGRTFGSLCDDSLLTWSKTLVEPGNERRHITHLEPIWNKSEADLTPKLVKDVLAGLLRPTGPLSASTVNKVRSTGRRVIREAQLNGEWGSANPFDPVRRMREPRREYVVLTKKELRAVLPHLRADRRRMALVMVYLGLRPGELIALLKSDVNLEELSLVVRRSRSRDTTKTGKTRWIPIPRELAPVLREAIDEAPGAHVFPGTNGKKLRDDTKLARCLQDAFRKAGLVTAWRYSCRRKGCGHNEKGEQLDDRRCPRCSYKLWAHGEPKRVRFYDLRHSAATLHREAGCDPLVVKLVMGHAARDTTDDVYTHLSPEFMRAELNKFSLYEEKNPPPPASGGGPTNNVPGGEQQMESAGTQFNGRPRAWEARALPTELPPQLLAGGVTPTLLTVKDVARQLNVSTRKVYGLVESGELASVRVGGAIRFAPETIESFISKGGVQ